MIRLDKFLGTMEIGTRSQIKELIKKGQVTLNGQICTQADCRIQEELDQVCVQGKRIFYEPLVYYMLNKPAGVVSATKDNLDRTVMDLLKGASGKELFPVGRLDKDTEGLLIITNDGNLSHRLLSPKKHVPKTYYVKAACRITEEMKRQLEQGVDIGEDKPSLPAKVRLLDESSLELTITEGKCHQVKRMLKAVGNEVIYLKRLSMGMVFLDEGLAPGEYRRLTPEEVLCLKNSSPH